MTPGLRLNLGSSALLQAGFDNLDREKVPGTRFCDVRLGLPYPNACAEIVCASHLFEHLHPFLELGFLLEEVHRVLRPDGLLRLAVPDLRKLVDAYRRKDFAVFAGTQKGTRTVTGVAFDELPPALAFSAIVFGNYSRTAWYDGHWFCADLDALVWLLERKGFHDVAEVSAGVSRHPTLMQTYRDADAPEQIIVEARP